MAVRQLARVLEILAAGNPQALRGGQTVNVSGPLAAPPAFVQQGQVENVRDDGTYQVFSDGLTRDATAATDEPILAGMQVWISQTREGAWILHGTVKG